MMKCGFEDWKECTEKCKYFNTCARNPVRNEEEENGRCEVDKNNNRCI